MASKFTIGDLVQLKSDGPRMTISNVFTNSYVHTVWFSGHEVKSGEFHSDVLKKVDE